MVVHTFNTPNTHDAEADKSLSSGSCWSTYRVMSSRTDRGTNKQTNKWGRKQIKNVLLNVCSGTYL